MVLLCPSFCFHKSFLSRVFTLDSAKVFFFFFTFLSEARVKRESESGGKKVLLNKTSNLEFLDNYRTLGAL